MSPDPDARDALRAALDANFKRSLALWVVRWVIGMGLAIAIVVFTGDHQWLPWAAAAVALVSLAMIVIMNKAQMRKLDSKPDQNG